MQGWKSFFLFTGVLLAASSSARGDCDQVDAAAVETVVPSPHDPLGRLLGTVEGTLTGADTAVLISVTSRPDGSFNITASYAFVTREGDMLLADAIATYTQISGRPRGEVQVAQSLTVTGGTGLFFGASGFLTASGQGHNVFSGPGVAMLNLRYTGQICH